MADLRELSRGYLAAEGYEPFERGRDLIVGRRNSLGGDSESIYVWVPREEKTEPLGTQERQFIKRFEEISNESPQAQKFMLVPSLEGLSREFRSAAGLWGVKVRVPAQFFDTSFRWEESDIAPSAARSLRQRGAEILIRRVPQPYTSDNTSGLDLLETLFDRLRNPATARKAIHLVTAPAGSGKSYLFEGLFARVYDAFQNDKRRLESSPRPLPLLPEHLPSSPAENIRVMLDSYLQTDFTRPLSEHVFRWMITNGLATWMLDGLDEVIARDRTFLEYLLDLLTTPEGELAPQIVVCLRDSLLQTHPELREFCEENESHVAIYYLDEWGLASKRQFAVKRLGNRAADFVSALQSSSTLDGLSSNPYYCSLLADAFEGGELKGDYSEEALVGEALASMIRREYAKGFINPAVIGEQRMTELLTAVASEDMTLGFKGVPIDEVRELAEIALPADVPAEEIERAVVQMMQLPFLAQGGSGQIRFAQEVLEHYLLGIGLSSTLSRNPQAFLRALSFGYLPRDWLTLRILGEGVRSRSEQGQLYALLAQATSPDAFKNVLQALINARQSEGVLQSVALENHDISGLEFRDLDLRGVSFINCDLTDTEFHDCKLQSASFVGAILKNTAFLCRDEALRDAQFGDLARFYSLRPSAAVLVSEPSQAANWIRSVTGAAPKAIEPCAAALQLRHLFGKFAYPNGDARRTWLDLKGTLSGKRFADPEATLDAAVRYGYLRKEDWRKRILRQEGDSWGELVRYSTTLDLSPVIRELLDDLCAQPGCPHVPRLTP